MTQKQTQVRMPPDVHAWLTAQAKASNRSLNGQMVEIFTQAMKMAAKATQNAAKAA